MVDQLDMRSECVRACACLHAYDTVQAKGTFAFLSLSEKTLHDAVPITMQY